MSEPSDAPQANDTVAPETLSVSPLSYKDLWFDDGSIILQSPTASFRVHRSILSFHSQVFRDMFVVSAPVEDAMVDGVPVVHVQDDAESLFQLLKALYFPRHIRKGTAMEMSLVVLLIEMATKYMVDFLRDELVSHLRLLFPSTLEDYLKTWEAPLKDICCKTDGLYAVEVAVKFGIPEILPMALYESARLESTLEELLYGTRDVDDTLVQLSSANLKTLLLGQHRLHGLKRRLSFKFIREYLAGEAGMHCQQKFGDLFVHLLVDDTDEDSNGVCFEDDVDLIVPKRRNARHNLVSALGICDTCSDEFWQAEKASWETVWEEIPKCFGLEWPTGPGQAVPVSN
ncbi:hypothetical protein FA95DRAFT_1604350 [Auriscalpium vulgare]|uniref:Uncharacterized protein n=1 Tax=Auriscalpium vulgare TaxID=40419 RepID=A0ACB8RZI7_9AGAM|nr:hypothetical protein FA95DRAFT_1604350 [Auriscalpium vulgare]